MSHTRRLGSALVGGLMNELNSRGHLQDTGSTGSYKKRNLNFKETAIKKLTVI